MTSIDHSITAEPASLARSFARASFGFLGSSCLLTIGMIALGAF